jgi:hypothetical protein
VIQAIKDILRNWNAAHSERAKLQHIYLAVGILGIILAGLVGLIDYDASRAILRLCFVALGIFLVNAIVWALLFSLVITRLPVTAQSTEQKEKAKPQRK